MAASSSPDGVGRAEVGPWLAAAHYDMNKLGFAIYLAHDRKPVQEAQIVVQGDKELAGAAPFLFFPDQEPMFALYQALKSYFGDDRPQAAPYPPDHAKDLKDLAMGLLSKIPGPLPPPVVQSGPVKTELPSFCVKNECVKNRLPNSAFCADHGPKA